MTSSPRRRGLRPLAVAAAVGLLLSGCGAQPGVAARVGDDSISLSQVDRDAALLCEAFEPQLQGQVYPMRFLRAQVLGSLLERTIGHQVAAEYGVEAGASYQALVSEQRAGYESLPERTRATVLDLATASAYRQSVLEAAADAELRAEGVAAPTQQQVAERGQDIFNQWPNDHEVVLDPRFGLEVVDGQIASADTALSFGLSAAARDGSAAEPDPTYAQSLPDSQRCG